MVKNIKKEISKEKPKVMTEEEKKKEHEDQYNKKTKEYFKNVENFIPQLCDITNKNNLSMNEIQEKGYLNEIVILNKNNKALIKKSFKNEKINYVINPKDVKKVNHEIACFILKNEKENSYFLSPCVKTEDSLNDNQLFETGSVGLTKKLKNILSNDNVKVIGWFHSHPGINISIPSDADIYYTLNLNKEYNGNKNFPFCIGNETEKDSKISCYLIDEKIVNENLITGSSDKIEKIRKQYIKFDNDFDYIATKNTIGQIFSILSSYYYDDEKGKIMKKGFQIETDDIRSDQGAKELKNSFLKLLDEYIYTKDFDCNSKVAKKEKIKNE
jgi:proteasome lid subunit RPN8/RPN11